MGKRPNKISYLAEPDHEPETELGYQETVVDNVVEPCH